MISEAQSSRITLAIALALFLCGLALAGYGGSLIAQDQPIHGIEFIGLSLMVASGCLDPINFLWLCLPLTVHSITPPTRYARFRIPLTLLGLFLVVASWLAEYWVKASN